MTDKPAARRGVHPLPTGSELWFIQANRTGTVHFTVKYPTWYEDQLPTTAVHKNGAAFVALMSSPTVTACGQRTFPGNPAPDARHNYTDTFADDRLCGRCYRTLHPDDHELAFQHAQPAGSDPAEDDGYPRLHRPTERDGAPASPVNAP